MITLRNWLAGFVAVGCVATSTAILTPSRTGLTDVQSAKVFYWTCAPLEPDSLACAWLITKFVAPGCEVRVLAEGGHSAEGIPFDLPMVALTRDRTHSSFQVVRMASGLDDSRLIELGKQIDAIELRSWNSQTNPDRPAIETLLRQVIDSGNPSEQQLTAAAGILDQIYSNLAVSLMELTNG